MADHTTSRIVVQSGMLLDHDRSSAMPYNSPSTSREKERMTRSALRCAIGAGFLLTAMASASAQVLEIGTDLSPTGLDPHLVTAFPTLMIVSGNIYEGLTAIDKDLKVTPGLAKSWSVSADGKTYTFKLHPGVKFHDGSRDGSRRRGVILQARAEQGDRLSVGKPAGEHREREGGRSADRRAEAERTVGAAAGIACHNRHRPKLGRDRQGRVAEAASGNRSVQVHRMAAERIRPALAQRCVLGKRPAEACRPQVQHRARIGNPASGPRQRPIRYPAEHRRIDGFAAQGQAGREARRDARTRLCAGRHERVETPFRQCQSP